MTVTSVCISSSVTFNPQLTFLPRKELDRRAEDKVIKPPVVSVLPPSFANKAVRITWL